MVIIDQWNQTARLHEIQVTVIYSRAILVAVTSECRVKRVICKTWIETLANSADPDQTPCSAASDLGLHCLLKLQEVKILSPRPDLCSQPALRDNRPTSAFSALILYFASKLGDTAEDPTIVKPAPQHTHLPHPILPRRVYY